MIQQDKELLLKDICARLPYGVVCDIYNATCTIKERLVFSGLARFIDDTICLRPYLRPMSSMTNEERKYFQTLAFPYDFVDALNKHHFDYRGLIDKGLAIAVTKENNPYK